MNSCPWCIKDERSGSVKCRSEDEESCDFKNLPYDKQSIIERIDIEFEFVESVLKNIKKIKDDKNEMERHKYIMADKLLGIKVMIDALKSDFNYKYQPKRNPFAFTALVMKAKKYF